MSTTSSKRKKKNRTEKCAILTLRDLHLGDRLPSIHRDIPRIAFSSAAQIQDQLGLVVA